MNPEVFMQEALWEAEKALSIGEVPVGAVIEKDGIIIGRGHNMTETAKDPTAHAEMLAIREAAQKLGGWRLLGCQMYVTTEPCSMCAGAIVLARIQKVCFGTLDPKAGACGSLMNILQDERLNHNVQIETGIMQQQCEKIMKSFFQKLRKKKSEENTI
jgi:tRNA(adenine34) deaminase